MRRRLRVLRSRLFGPEFLSAFRAEVEAEPRGLDVPVFAVLLHLPDVPCPVLPHCVGLVLVFGAAVRAVVVYGQEIRRPTLRAKLDYDHDSPPWRPDTINRILAKFP